MMVPAPPAADLVFVEPDLPFRLLEAGFDGPATRRDLAEQEQRHSWWSIGQVELELGAIGVAAEDGGHLATEHPGPEVPHAVLRELVDAWPLGAEADRERLPPVCGHPVGQFTDGRRPFKVVPLAPEPGSQGRHRTRTRDRADAGRRRHFEEIPEAIAVERVSKARIAPVNRVAGYPARLQVTGGPSVSHHGQRLDRLGGKSDLVRHPGRP